MDLHQPVQRHRGAGGTQQLILRAIGLNIKAPAKVCNSFLYLCVLNLPAQNREFVDLDKLDVPTEIGALLSKVGINVEHSAVIVSHHSEAIVLHDMSDSRGLDPFRDFSPGNRIVLQRARNLKKWDFAAVENVRDLWHRTRLAV